MIAAVWRRLPVIVFFALAPLALGVRNDDLFTVTTVEIPGAGFQGSTMALRLGGPLLYSVIETVLHWLAHAMMVAPDQSLLYQGSPWDTYAHSADYFHGRFIPFAASMTTRLLLLAMSLAVALHWFRKPLTQALCVAAILLTVGGWPPVLVNLIFMAGSLICDWPRAYYLFAHHFIYSDMPAIAFVLGLVLLLSRTKQLTLPMIAAMAALGQLAYEHLGLVTGVACALATLTIPALDGARPWRTAVLRLIVAGFGAGAMLALLVTATHALAQPVGGSGRNYVQIMWDMYGQYNFLWWRVLIANMVSLLVLPLLAGALIGVIARRAPQDAPAVVQRDARAAVAVIAGLACAIFIGLFVSGFAGDMGRQSVALILVSMLACAKTVQGMGRR